MPRTADPSADVPEVIVPPPAAPPPPPPPDTGGTVGYQPPPGPPPATSTDPSLMFPVTTPATGPGASYTTPGGTTVQPGGLQPTQSVLADGTTVTTFPDGSAWVWYPDGTLDTTVPNPDGSFTTTTTLPNGAIAGSTTTTWNPDGTTTTTTSGGGAQGGTGVPGGGGGPGAVPGSGGPPTGIGGINPPGGGTAGGTPSTPLDWKAYLLDWGFPADVVDQIDQIFRKYDADHVAQATAAAMAYIRSTTWYKQTFPGIEDGIKAGLFSDEVGYRRYVGDINDLTQGALGRAPTTDEILSYINRGWSASRVSLFFNAQGFVTAERGLLPAGIFTDEELQKIADFQAGVPGAEGQALLGQFQYAQNVNPVFLRHFGRNMTRDEINQYMQTGQTADALERHFTGQEFVEANRPEFQYLTGNLGAGTETTATPEELAAYGDQSQGLNTLLGAQVNNRIEKARQRLAGLLQGTLAQPSLSILGGQRKVATGLGRNLQTPDIGA